MKKIILSILTTLFLVLLVAPSIKAQPIEGPPRDGFYDKLYMEQKRPAELPYVREADVLYAKRVWQRIDLREKINQTMYFPTEPTGGRKSLTQVLYDAIREGSITAYDGFDDDFNQPLTPEQVINRLEDERTMTLEDGRDTTYTVAFDPTAVTRIHIKEDWFFDSKRSVLDVRIIGICPLRERFDPETGESIGFEPIFWVYFPEARSVLVNEEVYNRHNDAHRVSYDDMFLRRMFNSYIYKESNVYDRSIEEYFTGLDALLEAKEIKNNVREFEHDLWEY